MKSPLMAGKTKRDCPPHLQEVIAEQWKQSNTQGKIDDTGSVTHPYADLDIQQFTV